MDALNKKERVNKLGIFLLFLLAIMILSVFLGNRISANKYKINLHNENCCKSIDTIINILNYSLEYNNNLLNILNQINSTDTNVNKGHLNILIKTIDTLLNDQKYISNITIERDTTLNHNLKFLENNNKSLTVDLRSYLEFIKSIINKGDEKLILLRPVEEAKRHEESAKATKQQTVEDNQKENIDRMRSVFTKIKGICDEKKLKKNGNEILDPPTLSERIARIRTECLPYLK